MVAKAVSLLTSENCVIDAVCRKLRKRREGRPVFGIIPERRVIDMSDYEMLSIMLMFIGIIVSILIAYINK